MSRTEIPERAAERRLRGIIRSLLLLLSALFVFAPGFAALYLYAYGGMQRFARAPDFHVFIISLAIAFSAFVSYIAWVSYLRTGRLFQRWLFLGLAGFTLIYAPHGLLTNVAGQNIWLFILYGPASRLVMGTCFLLAVLNYGHEVTPGQARSSGRRLLLQWGGAFLLVCVLVAMLALSPLAGERIVRWGLEGLAILVFAAALVQMFRQHLDTRMMRLFAMVLLLFMQASVAFLFPVVWSHSWWFAHVIFAAGFGLLSYQVGQLYLRTGSFEDVFNEEELLQTLRQSNANYQRLAREQGRFAHLVSHDLQAPLRKLSMQLSRLDAPVEPSMATAVDRMQQLIEQMQQTIVSLLRLAEVSNVRLHKEPVDLNELLAAVLEIFQEELDQIGAVVRCRQLPTVSGDRALLFNVFQNLLQNAIKYRRERPMLFLLVYAEQRGSFWRIVVQDNGRGFEQAHAEDAFRMLGRLENTAISGTGAGLAICRKIVERHGGRISVESEPGRGASFRVELPVTDVEQPPPAADGMPS